MHQKDRLVEHFIKGYRGVGKWKTLKLPILRKQGRYTGCYEFSKKCDVCGYILRRKQEYEEDNLKECPFCGGKARISSGFADYDIYIECSNCGRRTRNYIKSIEEAKAMQDWNRRCSNV